MQRWWLVGFLAVVLLSVGACGSTDGDSGGTDEGSGDEKTKSSETGGVSTLEDVEAATVYIEAKGGSFDLERSFGELNYGFGSGFIIEEDGIAVTANHVVTGAGYLEVYVEGEDEPREARVIGASECSDLALIDIDGGGYPYLDWYDKPEIQEGLEVTAAGFPGDDVSASPGETPDYTVTKGIVNTTDADGETSWASVDSVIEHDALIRDGSSGGPLVDESGSVLGVNYASRLDEDGDPTGQELAISRDEAQEILTNLRVGDGVDSIGISGEAVSYPDQEVSGVQVQAVETGSAASNAGIEGRSIDRIDIITELEGTRLAENFTMEEYCNILGTRSTPDQPLSVQVVRVGLDDEGNYTDEVTVLEGEINGKPLKPVEETSAQSGTMTSNSDSAATSGYTTVTDETGTLTMDVPSAWTDVVNGNFELNDTDVGVSMGAAADYDAYVSSFKEPGAYMAASSSLAQEHPDDVEEVVLEDRDFAGACTKDGRYDDYDDGTYTGKYEVWVNCDGGNNAFSVLAAVPQDRSFVVLVETNMVNEGDLDAQKKIWNTFEVLEQPA